MSFWLKYIFLLPFIFLFSQSSIFGQTLPVTFYTNKCKCIEIIKPLVWRTSEVQNDPISFPLRNVRSRLWFRTRPDWTSFEFWRVFNTNMNLRGCSQSITSLKNVVLHMWEDRCASVNIWIFKADLHFQVFSRLEQEVVCDSGPWSSERSLTSPLWEICRFQRVFTGKSINMDELIHLFSLWTDD